MNTDADQADPHALASAAVVVGADGSGGSHIAVRWAADLAARRGRRLLIVHGFDIEATRAVRNSYDAMNPAVQHGLRNHGETLVAAARQLAQEAEADLIVDCEVSPDSPARLLIRHSQSANLVVVGATGALGAIAHLGSTVLTVAAHGHGSIVVVRGADITGTTRSIGPVVVGVDGSAVSDAAVAAAFREAAVRDSDLFAVHTWTDLDTGHLPQPELAVPAGDWETAEDAVLAERLAGWQEKYPDVGITRKVDHSGPARTLTKYSKFAQLVVVGSRGRGGFSGLLLGSTSSALVQHAHCPVMVVHPD